MVDKPEGTHSNPLYTKIASPETTGWAKDATLAALLDKASDNNELLAEYIKKVAPDLEKKTDDILNKTNKNLADKLDVSTKNNEDEAKRKQKADDAALRELEGVKETYRRGTSSIIGTLKSTDPTATIAEQSRSLIEGMTSSLGGAIGSMFGPAGTMIGKVTGSAIGVVLGEVPARTLELSKMYREMYDTGISFNGSMEEMTKVAFEAGVSVENLTANFKKYSETVVAVGAGRMGKFNAELQNITKNGAQLGYTLPELADAAGGYAEQQLRLGEIGRQSTEDLTAGAANYLNELTGLSQLTGKSRKTLEDEQKARMQSTRQLAAARLLDEDSRKRLAALSRALPEEQANLARAIMLQQQKGLYTFTKDQQTMMQMMDPSALAEFRAAIADTSKGLEYTTDVQAKGTAMYQAAVNPLLDIAAAGQRGAESLAGAGESYTKGKLETEATQAQIQKYMDEHAGATADQATAAIKLAKTLDIPTENIFKTINDIDKGMAKAKDVFDQGVVKAAGALSNKVQEVSESLGKLVGPLEKFGSSVNSALEAIGIKTGMSPLTTGVLTGGATLATGVYGGYKAAQAGMGSKTVAALGAEVPGTGAKAAAEAAEAGIKGAAKEAMETSIAKAAATTAAEVGFKGIMKGIPFLGDVAEGLLAYEQSGSIGKGIAAGTGSLVGRAGAFAAGTATTGVGGIIAQAGGSIAGAQGGKMLYDYIFGGGTPSETKSETQIQELQKMNQSLSGIHETIPNMIQRAPYGGPEDLIGAGRFDSVSLMGAAGMKGAEAISSESARIIAATLTETAITPTATDMGASATPTAEDPIKRKTVDFYDQSYLASNNMITLLKDIADKLDQLNQNVVDQTSDLDRSITSISGTII